MSKKAFILFILCLVAIFGAMGWYFLFRTESIPGMESGEVDSSNPFPFGQGSAAGNQPIENPTPLATSTVDISGNGREEAPPRLRQVSLVPTAGAVVFGSDDAIRFIERATGHIYETLSGSSVVRRVSSVTIPKVSEALWSNDGSKLLIRYLKDDGETVRTFYAKVSSTTKPEAALEGLFLPEGIRTISLYGNRAFYILESESGAQGYTSNLDGSNRASIFTSAFSDWDASWDSANAISVYSRPSGLSSGSAFLLEPTSGRLSRITGDEIGLIPLLSSDAARMLMSVRSQNKVDLATLDIKTGISASLGLATLSEKCVWSAKEKSIAYCALPNSIPNGIYPDDWYKGKVSFNDSLWRIDVLTGETDEVMDPELEAGVSMDMIKLSLDSSEEIVLLTNKKDMTVWRYELK